MSDNDRSEEIMIKACHKCRLERCGSECKYLDASVRNDDVQAYILRRRLKLEKIK